MVREAVLPLVRRAREADIDPMAAQLAKTFWDDPVTSHIFRAERRRDAGLKAYFATQMRADYMPFGGCWTTDGYAGIGRSGLRRASRSSPGSGGY